LAQARLAVRRCQGGLARAAVSLPPPFDCHTLTRYYDSRFIDSLPKTRSGKIMRRLLKEIAAGGDVKGDTTTPEDFTVIAKLRADEE
jgi:acyl-CoA synthetase (AMP-forming)/AMP-acid ligase II